MAEKSNDNKLFMGLGVVAFLIGIYDHSWSEVLFGPFLFVTYWYFDLMDRREATRTSRKKVGKVITMPGTSKRRAGSITHD